TVCNNGQTKPGAFVRADITINAITRRFKFNRNILAVAGSCDTDAKPYTAWRLEKGKSYVVQAVVDPDDDVKEINENNNMFSTTITAFSSTFADTSMAPMPKSSAELAS